MHKLIDIPEENKTKPKPKIMTTFQELKQGNQLEAGTNQKIREKVMHQIIAKNPNILLISVKGKINLLLYAKWSLSGKTVIYESNISKEIYIEIMQLLGFKNPEFGLSQKYEPSFLIDMDGRCAICGGGNYYHKLMDNKDIEILNI